MRMFLFLSSLSLVAFAFAIYNTGSFGIPFFWVTGFLGFILSKSSVPKSVLYAFIFQLFSLAVLLLVHPNEIQLFQSVARLMIVLSVLGISKLLLTNKACAEAFVSYSFVILSVCFVYGIYELYAKLQGKPLFLDVMSNNSSFEVTDGHTLSSWIGFYRSRSIWPEPSSASIPIITYFLILFNRPKFGLIFTLLPIGFAALTFSRTVWFVTVVLLLLHFILFITNRMRIKDKIVFNLFLKTRILHVIFVLIILGINFWPFIVSSFFNDLSVNGRSASILVGGRIFWDYPFFGTGFNSYATFEPFYHYGIFNYKAEGSSLNIFTSYLQQAGIIGFVFIITPLYVIWKQKTVYVAHRIIAIFSLLLVGSLAGDVFYYAILWACVLVFVAIGKSVSHFIV